MRKELKILNSVSAMFIVAAGLLGPIYASYVAKIGGDLIITGVAYSIFAITSGVLILLVSRWEDHLKHKEKILVVGYALGFVGFVGYLLVGNPIQLFAVQLILGIATAIRVPVFDGIYSRNLSKRRYTSEWGVWEAVDQFGLGVSAIVGGFVATIFGFDGLFVLMAATAFCGLVISTFLLINKSKS